MGSVSIPVDPASALAAPSLGSGSDPMNDLRMRAGIIFGSIDAVCNVLTGFSPLKEWVFKPLAGDWDGLNKGASAWQNAGKAASALAESITQFPRQIGDDWAGETALSWAQANGVLVGTINKLPEQCERMATTCSAIADAAQAVAGLIADALGQLSETLAQAGIEACIPVAGWVAEAETAAQLAYQITSNGIKISNAIQKFVRLLEKLRPILDELLGIGKEIGVLASKLASAAPKVIEASRDIAKEAETIKKTYDTITKVKDVTDKVEQVKDGLEAGVDAAVRGATAYSSAEASAR